MKILFATDGQPPARRAQKVLEKIGRRSGHTVRVMSVAGVSDDVPVLEDRTRNRIDEARQVSELATGELRNEGFDADGFTRPGSPAAEILKAIDELQIDLTILGAGHRTWLGNLILGSVGTHVLHSSPTSVLIVHEWFQEPATGRVLVGTDGSSYSQRATELFARFADPGRCNVTVVAVAPNAQSTLVRHPALAPTYEPFDQHRQEEVIEWAEGHGTRAREMLQKAGFEASSATSVGSAANVLLKEADSRRTDLVVVGSRGLGPVERTALGSVSDNVARHAAAALVARGTAASPLG